MKPLMMCLTALFLACGCGAECEKMAKRCFENKVQLCDTAGRWSDVIRCEEVEPGEWKCGCQGDKCNCRKAVTP